MVSRASPKRLKLSSRALKSGTASLTKSETRSSMSPQKISGRLWLSSLLFKPATLNAAEIALNDLEKTWGDKYPTVVKSWRTK